MKAKAGRKPRKNQILILCVAGALAIAAAVCALAGSAQGGALEAQKAAVRFRGESKERFAQVSAFFPVGKETDLAAVRTFRSSMEGKLLAASLEAPENGSLWQDAYSAESKATVKGVKGSAQTAVLGVGGDFFAFHTLTLRSGAYISEDDLMHDSVLLDETLAWKLFGGYDLAGMTVYIGGTPYLVSGVVTRETDRASRAAYKDEGCMYMHYDALNALTEEGVGISTYELCCADPITGFALDVVTTGFPDAVTLQNSGRFTPSRLLKVVGAFGERAMATQGLSYPYWENAARLTENRCAVLLLACLALGLFPLVCLVWTAVFFLRRGWGSFRGVASVRWERWSDALREKRRLRLLEKEKQQFGE